MNAVDWINSQQNRVREIHRRMWDSVKQCFQATFIIWLIKHGKELKASDINFMSVIYTRYHGSRGYEKLNQRLEYDEKTFNETLSPLERSLMFGFNNEYFPFPGLPDDAFEILQKVLAVEHVDYTCTELLVISVLADDLPENLNTLDLPDLWSPTRLRESKMIRPLISKIRSGSLANGFNRGSETGTKNPPDLMIQNGFATRPRVFQPITLTEPVVNNQTDVGLPTTLKDFVNEKDDSSDQG